MKKKILLILLLVFFTLIAFCSNVYGVDNNNQDIYRTVTDTEQEDGSHRIDYRIYNARRKT